MRVKQAIVVVSTTAAAPDRNEIFLKKLYTLTDYTGMTHNLVLSDATKTTTFAITETKLLNLLKMI